MKKLYECSNNINQSINHKCYVIQQYQSSYVQYQKIIFAFHLLLQNLYVQIKPFPCSNDKNNAHNNSHNSHQTHFVYLLTVPHNTDNITHNNRRKYKWCQHCVVFGHQQSLGICQKTYRYGCTHKNSSFEGFPHGRNMVIRIGPPKGKKDCTDKLKESPLRVHDMQRSIMVQFFSQSQSHSMDAHDAQKGKSSPHQSLRILTEIILESCVGRGQLSRYLLIDPLSVGRHEHSNKRYQQPKSLSGVYLHPVDNSVCNCCEDGSRGLESDGHGEGQVKLRPCVGETLDHDESVSYKFKFVLVRGGKCHIDLAVACNSVANND